MGSGDYGLWGPPALRGPCRASAAGCLAQGKVILAASTFRRLKMRWDLCSGTSITAHDFELQSRSGVCLVHGKVIFVGSTFRR
jgi:hypothetical protein